MVKMLVRDKHSSLFYRSLSDKKSFSNIDFKILRSFTVKNVTVLIRAYRGQYGKGKQNKICIDVTPFEMRTVLSGIHLFNDTS